MPACVFACINVQVKEGRQVLLVPQVMLVHVVLTDSQAQLAPLGLVDSQDHRVMSDLQASLDSLAAQDLLAFKVPMVQQEQLEGLEGLE